MRESAFDPYSNKGRMSLYVHPAREGRAMKDMASIYLKMSTDDLMRLRSKKVILRTNAENRPWVYERDLAVRLTWQITRIDAVLKSRIEQLPLMP